MDTLNFFHFTCINVLSACMPVCHMHAQCPQMLDDPGAGVGGGCELPSVGAGN